MAGLAGVAADSIVDVPADDQAGPQADVRHNVGEVLDPLGHAEVAFGQSGGVAVIVDEHGKANPFGQVGTQWDIAPPHVGFEDQRPIGDIDQTWDG